MAERVKIWTFPSESFSRFPRVSIGFPLEIQPCSPLLIVRRSPSTTLPLIWAEFKKKKISPLACPEIRLLPWNVQYFAKPTVLAIKIIRSSHDQIVSSTLIIQLDSTAPCLRFARFNSARLSAPSLIDRVKPKAFQRLIGESHSCQ